MSLSTIEALKVLHVTLRYVTLRHVHSVRQTCAERFYSNPGERTGLIVYMVIRF